MIGVIDKVLRPVMVDKVTQMPDRFKLISTPGRMDMFRAVELIIGLVIGGLIVTMWELF